MNKDLKRKLFFRSVPNSCSLKVLKSYFKAILASKFTIKKGKNKGKKKSGFATITVSAREDEETLTTSKHQIDGNELLFQKYKTDDELFLEAANMLQKRIYVNNLPHNVKRSEIIDLFSRFGVVRKVFLKPKKAENTQTGDVELKVNSYVNFERPEDVKKCLDNQPLFIGNNLLELYQKTTPKKREKMILKIDDHHKNFQRERKNLEKFSQLEVKKNLEKKIWRKKKLGASCRYGGTNRLWDHQRRNEPYPAYHKFHLHSPTIRGRGKAGRFIIQPFTPVDTSFADWMGHDSNYYFSYKNLVPMRFLSGKLLGSKAHDLQIEDEGYNHSFSNLRLNKFN